MKLFKRIKEFLVQWGKAYQEEMDKLPPEMQAEYLANQKRIL
jgi:hypothetical protein